MPEPLIVTPDYRKIWREFAASGRSDERNATRIDLVGSFTVDALVPYLGGQLLHESSEFPDIRIAPYNQILQYCINPEAVIGSGNADVVVIVWRIEDLFPALLDQAFFGDSNLRGRLFGEVKSLFDAIQEFRKVSGGTIVVSTPPYPSTPSFAPGELHQPARGGLLYSRILTYFLERLTAMPGVRVLDLHASLMLAGYADQHDLRKWYLYKQPYTDGFYARLAAQLSRIIRSRRASSKKCVVVDCDNTIWGGIVGEEGLAGIELGGSFPGAAFEDFQRFLLVLRQRGIFLAVASKNNEADVFEVFDRHDAMVLGREDISVFEVHWQSKVGSLQRIAASLNIGLESLVFVDDNAKEIAEINERLPEVTAIMVPDDVACLPALLADSGLFDATDITDEDRARVDMLHAEQLRRGAQKVLSEGDFLNSLELKIDVFEVLQQHVARVTQLINKTNQFNLRTSRYTADQVMTISVDTDRLLLGMEVSDRFGNYGLVGVACLARITSDEWFVSDFLMSCRVLGRGVETAFLAKVSEAAGKLGAKFLRGEYLRTAKNSQVELFYPQHGFAPANQPGQWLAPINAVRKADHHVSASLRMAR